MKLFSDKRYRNTIFSILGSFILHGVIYSIYYILPFALVWIFLFADIIGISAGIVLIFLKFKKKKTNIIYNYFGVFNIISAVILLYFVIDEVKQVSVFALIISGVLVGSVILYDIFKKDKTINSEYLKNKYNL